MLLVTNIEEISIHQPCGLTIGIFDGVHLGHQTLLKHLRAKLPSNGLLAVFTFSTHPSQHFTPDNPTLLICPPLQRAKLLSDYGADIVILTPFTPEFAKTPFDHFLRHLKQKLSFSHLVLGENATFGKNREGNEENIKRLAPELKFQVEYLPKFTLHGAPLSSGRVRTLIAKGAFHETQECLGRPYSLMGQLYSFNTTGLCLPPEGIYPVRLKTATHEHLGRAHISPKEEKIRLELLHDNVPLDENEVEVIF